MHNHQALLQLNQVISYQPFIIIHTSLTQHFSIIGSKTKSTAISRLSESSAAAIRLGDIAERKLDLAERKLTLKKAYYQKKIKLKEENNALLRTLISTLSDKLPTP